MLVAEGAELLSVALAVGAPVESVYVAPEGRDTPAVAEVLGRAFDAGARVFDLAPGVLERVAGTVTPQPVLAVVGFTPARLDQLDATAGQSLVVVCADVRDPGNAGTVIRTADAVGADAVVCCDGTVDPTNPKTVRASAGSLFHLPVVVGGDVVTVVEELRRHGYTTVGTVVRGGVDYATVDWGGKVALVLGNEASGLPGEVTDLLDAAVSIPMAGRAESLNVSVAAAVVCFEVLRQRRLGHPPATGSAGAGPGRPASGSAGPASGSGGGSTMPGMEKRS